MRVPHDGSRAGEWIGRSDYHCQRRGSREARYRWTSAGNTQSAAPGSLEFFLLERYALFTADGEGLIFMGGVHHEPYRYGATEVEALSVDQAGL